jgi:ABC-type antimicrobial peptide transport system permease subunit
MIGRTFKTALRALRRNMMRAVLTCLGIIIGIGAVIAMVELSNGVATLIRQTISSMGANSMVIFPGAAASGGVSFGGGSSTTLTPEDCEAILRECPAVKNAAPIVRSRVQVVYGNKNWVPNQIYGTTPAYLDIRDWSQMARGESFSDRDVRNSSKICLLGTSISRELFGEEDPVGKEVRVNNVALKVIGVLTSKGANSWGQDQDDVLLSPWTTIKYRVSRSSLTNTNQSAAVKTDTANQTNTLSNLYPGSTALYPEKSAAQEANQPLPVRFANIDQISADARSEDEMQLAISQITDVLRERHRLGPGEPSDFTVRDMTEITQGMTTTTRVMSQLLLSVATISLIVGGIGIMNIMLVSVTERTREIGLRMAVGARARDILRQFLVEAVVLCLAGGAIGILLGRGASWLVTKLLGWPTAVSLPAIVVAVVVSAAVGIIFGYYPAWKASRLDPIEALHYE